MECSSSQCRARSGTTKHHCGVKSLACRNLHETTRSNQDKPPFSPSQQLSNLSRSSWKLYRSEAFSWVNKKSSWCEHHFASSFSSHSASRSVSNNSKKITHLRFLIMNTRMESEPYSPALPALLLHSPHPWIWNAVPIPLRLRRSCAAQLLSCLQTLQHLCLWTALNSQLGVTLNILQSH